MVSQVMAGKPKIPVSVAADPQDQLQRRFSVLAFQRPRERVAADAVVIDFVDLKQVFGDVVDGA